ncbi:ParA family protein [Fundicoccus sp. Sow4_H7]|uniref:ParA family protein n=1 Tax=Fundicoccus sp. Sow4_H7 TaxID=3438784 RepID=UPI003F8EEF45
MEVIALVNQKGGVGKSTTAQLLGNGLRHKGKRVLFVDLDQQGNLTYGVGINSPVIGSYEVLTKRNNIDDAIVTSAQGDILPATNRLAGLDIELFSEIGKEYRLKEALEPLKNTYDVVIVDAPPTLSTVVINALTASTKVIIPTQADIYSLQGLSQLANTLQTIRQYTNPNLFLEGILITRYNDRAILTREITDMIDKTAQTLGTKVFDTKIREAIAVKEAQAMRTDLFEYAPKANVTMDCMAFIDELNL